MHGLVKRGSRVQKAEERLKRAVGRLESALDKKHADSPKGGGAKAAQDLRELRQENQHLRQVTDILAQRLDGTIDRLKVILEN